MITDPDVTRAVRSWLDEDPDRLPERVLDAVLEKVPSTPQRRPWWPPRRLIDMTSKVQIAAAAAAVVLVAVVGLQLLSPAGGVGGPAPTPTLAPTAPPTPSPTIPGVAIGRPLDAGTYQVGTPFLAPFTLTVPTGWTNSTLTEGEAAFEGPAWVGVFKVDAVFPDPCKTADASPVPVSTADDALAALTSMDGFTTTAPSTDTVGGKPATRFELSNSIDTATAACTGDLMLPLFTSPGNPEGNATNGGTTATVWIVDTAIGPTLIWLDSYDAADDMAQLEQMVRSITFE